MHLIAPAGETIPVVMLPREARRIAQSLEEAADKAEESESPEAAFAPRAIASRKITAVA
jgi:hypothetical protein